MHLPLNEKRAVTHLMDLLKIEALSGSEQAVADVVIRKLLKAGCDESWIRSDNAHRKLEGFERGNLIVKLPGTIRAPRLLFGSHMDTVPLCRGAKPVRRGDRIESAGATALGGDNRTAVACLVTLAETLLREKLRHPPITLLFSVGEEVGLLGASAINIRDLGSPCMGFNIDSGDPALILIGATGAVRMDIEVKGLSAHAGMHPDHGISAVLIAARAVKEIDDRGYFGKILKGNRAGTSNVGVVQGGEATNQVTDRLFLRAEARSHDPVFLNQIVKNYRLAFESAAHAVQNNRAQKGSVEFKERKEYNAFRLADDAPVVKKALQAASGLGLNPKTISCDGGLDANPLNEKGLPTVTLGAGQHGAHTVEEYIDLPEYLNGCRLALAAALSWLDSGA